MPNIFFRGDDPPKVGENILAAIGFATVGSVWKIVNGTGKIIAKARVQKDYSKDPKFQGVRLFRDPRRDEDNQGKETTNTGKGIFGLTVEKTDETETLY